MSKGCLAVCVLAIVLLPSFATAVIDPAYAKIDYPGGKRNLTYCYEGEVDADVKANVEAAVRNWNAANTGYTFSEAAEPCKGDVKIRETPMGSGGYHSFGHRNGVITSSRMHIGTFASVRVIMHEFGHAMRLGHDPECKHKTIGDCEKDQNSPCHGPEPRNMMSAHQFSYDTTLTAKDIEEAKASARVATDKKVEPQPRDGQRNVMKPHVVEDDKLKLPEAESVAVRAFFEENIEVGPVAWNEHSVYFPLMPLEPAHGQEWLDLVVWYAAKQESAVFQGMLWVSDLPSVPGTLPHAVAPPDFSVYFGQPAGLYGDLSYHDDPAAKLVHYCWREDSLGWHGAGVEPVLDPGRHVIELTVHDAFGRSDCDTVVVTVRPPGAGWQEMKPVPAPPSGGAVKHGGWLAANRTTGAIYVAKGNKTGDFYAYYPANDSWHTLRKVGDGTPGPNEVGKGACADFDRRSRVYTAVGNNTNWFLRYDIADNSWLALARVPDGDSEKNVKGGGDLVFVGNPDTGYVYLLKGYGTEFYRYRVDGNAWQARLNAPDGGGKGRYYSGSFLVWDGAQHIYAHQAKYTNPAKTHHNMYRFNLATQSWDETLPGMPLLGKHGGKMKNKKSKDGADGAWHDGLLYALKGGNSGQFYRYTPTTGTWEELDTIPAMGSTLKKRRVKAGGGLTGRGHGIFYALKGGKTREFWRYVESAGTQARAQTPAENGVQAEAVGSGARGMAIEPNLLHSGFATLKLSHLVPWRSSGLLRVFDAAGRCVSSRSLVIDDWSLAISLDLRGLSGGVYLVRLEVGEITETGKLVIQR